MRLLSCLIYGLFALALMAPIAPKAFADDLSGAPSTTAPAKKKTKKKKKAAKKSKKAKKAKSRKKAKAKAKPKKKSHAPAAPAVSGGAKPGNSFDNMPSEKKDDLPPPNVDPKD